MTKTWNERCEDHPDHQTGMISSGMIQARMQEEIDDLRAALEQPEQEPVAWIQPGLRDWLCVSYDRDSVHTVPVYPHPPPPQRKPLTEEEIRRMKPISPDLVDFRSGVRCAKAAHGIKGEV